MIRLLARRWLRTFSQRYGYDTGYLHDMLETNLALFLKFTAINPLSSHRSGVPRAPWWTARIRAARWEDCDPCLALMCNMALEDGVDPGVITASVTADLAALDDDCALALHFTERVLAHEPDADLLREQVRLRWGDDGLLSLATTISATRVYPAVKYALGHSHACSRVQVAQCSVAPEAFASTTLAGGARAGVSQ